MKWNKAVKMIEKSLANGEYVLIRYHRKYSRNANDSRWGKAESVVPYDWNGNECKAVITIGDLLTEGSHTIESVEGGNDGGNTH